MRRSRAASHYAIRRVRKNKDQIVCDRIADSMLNKNDRNFCSEIKRIRSSIVGSSKIVDGITDINSISKLFADKYRELCSSILFFCLL